MSRKNSFLLRSVLLLVIITVLTGGIYSYASKFIINYYYDNGNSTNLTSMEPENFFVFPDGSSLVTGSFFQNNDPFEEKSLYITTYSNTGVSTETSSVELPRGYKLSDSITLSDRVYLLYTADSELSEHAVLYEVSSTGILLNTKDIIYTENPEQSRKYYIAASDNSLLYAVMSDNTFRIFTENDSALCEISLSAGVEINSFCAYNDAYILTGKTVNGETYNAYYAAFSHDGNQLYSVSTMTGYTSACTRVIPDSSRNGEFIICGFYFNSDTFSEEYYEGADALTQMQLYEIADKSINRAIENKSVLISADYLSAPWCSMFIIKLDSNGEFISSLSPVNAHIQNGISRVTYLSSIGSSSNKQPIITITASVAKNRYSSSYKTGLYTIYDDLSSDYSSDIKLNADTHALYTSFADGKLAVFTGINGNQEYSVHLYKNTEAYAREQNIIALCYYLVDFIDSSASKTPLIFVFILFMISVRYTYFDFIEKKRHY